MATQQTQKFAEEQDTETETKSEEELLEEMISARVLGFKIKLCPTKQFKNILDTDNGEAAFLLGKALNFTKGQMRKIRNNQAGGGEPHARFVDLLLTKEYSIDDVLDALQATDNTAAYDVLEKIRDDSNEIEDSEGYVDFSDLEPRQAFKLNALLYEDPQSDATNTWRGLAENLGMDESIPIIAAAMVHGGTYSGGLAFTKIMNTKNPTISEVQESLLKIKNAEEYAEFNDEYDFQAVIDAFEEDLTLKKQTEKKKEITKMKNAEKKAAKKANAALQ